MAKVLTGDLVVKLWADMQSEFNFKVLRKNKSSTMRMVGSFLQMIGVQDRGDFMNKYAVTFWDKIYIPYEIGKAAGRWGLVSQVTNLAHEAHHVVQFRKNPVKFPFKYITSTSARAHYEMESMRASMEVYKYLTGEMLEPALVASRLKAYGCKQKDIDVTQKSLEAAYKVIEKGGVVTETSQYLIMLMERSDMRVEVLPPMHVFFDKTLFL